MLDTFFVNRNFYNNVFSFIFCLSRVIFFNPQNWNAPVLTTNGSFFYKKRSSVEYGRMDASFGFKKH